MSVKSAQPATGIGEFLFLILSCGALRRRPLALQYCRLMIPNLCGVTRGSASTQQIKKALVCDLTTCHSCSRLERMRLWQKHFDYWFQVQTGTAERVRVTSTQHRDEAVTHLSLYCDSLRLRRSRLLVARISVSPGFTVVNSRLSFLGSRNSMLRNLLQFVLLDQVRALYWSLGIFFFARCWVARNLLCRVSSAKLDSTFLRDSRSAIVYPHQRESSG